MTSAVPAQVQAFRVAFREREVGPRYSGWGHFAFTTSVALAAVFLAVSRVRAPTLLEALVVPASFLFANLVEYLGHRGPMHHRTRGLTLLFERHTRQHHQFFTRDAMSFESSRDFKMVLFPPVLVVFFLGGIAVPIAGLLFWIASANAAWLFVAVAMGYFLTYEWLHFAYHTEPERGVGRLAVVRALRRHHARHHDKALMGHYNFNITFPIADALFGTTWRGTPDQRAPSPAAPGED